MSYSRQLAENAHMDKGHTPTGIKGVVKYPYRANKSEDINLTPGDIIYDIEVVEGQFWWRGTDSYNASGVFPSVFVDLIRVGLDPVNPVKKDEGSSRAVWNLLHPKPSGVNGIVKCAFQAREPGEMDLERGSTIYDIEVIEGQFWWWGNAITELGWTKGFFPSEFVRLIQDGDADSHRRDDETGSPADGVEDDVQPAQASSNIEPKGVYGIAKFWFRAREPAEMDLECEDTIYGIKAVQGQVWSWGTKSDGTSGNFPSAYVDIVRGGRIISNSRGGGRVIRRGGQIIWPRKAIENALGKSAGKGAEKKARKDKKPKANMLQ